MSWALFGIGFSGRYAGRAACFGFAGASFRQAENGRHGIALGLYAGARLLRVLIPFAGEMRPLLFQKMIRKSQKGVFQSIIGIADNRCHHD